jgi:farnesyl diphosphate synthase
MAAMRHGVLNGGKRLRPFLTVETARMLGRDGAGSLRAGAAVELLHCYSLVHDDLPSMDDDDLRRGQPTVHKAYDEATAILVGDALQTLAFEVVADPATDPDASVRADLVLGLARASGMGGMVGGQMLDLAAEGRYGEARLSEAEIRTLQAMKTGAILRFSVEAGAIVGRADPAARADLVAYGKALGAAFQVADDILDREASAEAMASAPARTSRRARAPWWTRSGWTARAGNAPASSRPARPRSIASAPGPTSCARPPASRWNGRRDETCEERSGGRPHPPARPRGRHPFIMAAERRPGYERTVGRWEADVHRAEMLKTRQRLSPRRARRPS